MSPLSSPPGNHLAADLVDLRDILPECSLNSNILVSILVFDLLLGAVRMSVPSQLKSCTLQERYTIDILRSVTGVCFTGDWREGGR